MTQSPQTEKSTEKTHNITSWEEDSTTVDITVTGIQKPENNTYQPETPTKTPV